MTVSSYLEAFLAVYGWETYYTLYLGLAASGLFLYPLCRAVLEQYIDYQGGNEFSGHNFMRSMVVGIVIMLAVWITALVPMVPISFDKTVVKTVCDRADVSINQFNEAGTGKSYFTHTNTRAPLLPWLAMSIGQGLNAVIYKQAPCALDLTEMQKNMLNVNLDNAEKPSELQNEKNRYMQECQAKIVKTIDDLNGGKVYSKKTNEWFQEKVREVSKDARGWSDFFRTNELNEQEVLQVLKSPDSELIKRYFFTENVPEELKPVIKGLNADGAVDGVAGPANGSKQQGTATPPSCKDWWQGQGDGGLRQKIAVGLSDSMLYKTMLSSGFTGPKECRQIKALNYLPGGAVLGMAGVKADIPLGNAQSCRKAIVDKIANGDDDNYVRQLLFASQGVGDARDSPLTQGENAGLTAAVGGAIGATIASKVIGVDLTGGVIGTITSFYGMMFILKLLLRYLVPFAEMAVFMFWGFYMVIGGMTGRTLIKGMMMIISITIIPSLWALISHLDYKLYEAMYGTHLRLDVFNMILLDTASTIFQVAIIYVLFHIVSLAGGGDASGALGGSDSSAKNYSQQIGRTGGKIVGGTSNIITQERKGAKGIAGGSGSKWARGLGSWLRKGK